MGAAQSQGCSGKVTTVRPMVPVTRPARESRIRAICAVRQCLILGMPCGELAVEAHHQARGRPVTDVPQRGHDTRRTGGQERSSEPRDAVARDLPACRSAGSKHDQLALERQSRNLARRPAPIVIGWRMACRCPRKDQMTAQRIDVGDQGVCREVHDSSPGSASPHGGLGRGATHEGVRGVRQQRRNRLHFPTRSRQTRSPFTAISGGCGIRDKQVPGS